MPPVGHLRLIVFGFALMLLTVVGLRALPAHPSDRGVAGVTISVPVEIIEDGEAPSLRRVEVTR